jgi:large subunit ribosomal protein L22
MDIKVKLNYLKIAPRKVRLVSDLIRGQRVDFAKSTLQFTVKKSAENILGLLNSGIASAKNNYGIEEDNLYISEIKVDEGPKLKRWIPRARGSASRIQKKTSHITIVLKQIEEKETIKKINKEIKPEKVRVSNIQEVKEDAKTKKSKQSRKKDNSSMITKDKNSNKRIFRRKSI